MCEKLSISAFALSVAIGVLAGCSSSAPIAEALPTGSTTAHDVGSRQIEANSVDQPSVAYRIVHSFGNREDGASPAGLLNLNGAIYGMTAYGGRSGNGTVFRITLPRSEVVLHSFAGAPDVTDPDGGLINVNGTFYGSSYFGGAYNEGAVFAITPSGRERIVHSFSGAPDGAYAVGNLLYVNGTLYGTTEAGGTGGRICGFSGCGTMFSISPSGKEKVLHRFIGRDGADPSGLIDVKGTLYGTTSRGGAHGDGTVFATAPSGRGRVLHSFFGKPDGYSPSGALLNFNGTLYGVTEFGGMSAFGCYYGGCGTVFSITPSGKETVLYRFSGLPDGDDPVGTLVNFNGDLYGVTYSGGAGRIFKGDGTVYSVTTSGHESVLHSFTGTPDGAFPLTGLIAVRGALYGTTEDGGVYGQGGTGTLYEISP